jgi:site-specific recombinase XerD
MAYLYEPDAAVIRATLVQHLARGETAHHLLAQGLLADLIDELLDHGQGDIRLQQRHAHFAHGILDILFGQAALAAQLVKYATKAFA